MVRACPMLSSAAQKAGAMQDTEVSACVPSILKVDVLLDTIPSDWVLSTLCGRRPGRSVECQGKRIVDVQFT